MTEVARTLTINHETGMHCRPSASFVKVASQFQSEIFVEKDGTTVNGKSIMGLLMLAAERGSQINIHAIGNDAVNAMDALENLVKADFTCPA